MKPLNQSSAAYLAYLTCLGAATATLLTVSLPACADVVNISSNGFLIRHEVQLNVNTDAAYDMLVNQVGSWWNPSHTYTLDTKNLSIDARPGGCFCEKFPKGGGVQHMSVAYVLPGKLLRMTGALGPMQSSGLAGSMSWDFIAPDSTDKSKGSSKLVLTYSVGGYMQGGFEKMAPAADAMLGEQLSRFRNLANTGKPD